eukprot:400570-Rhodomonas_salina.1
MRASRNSCRGERLRQFVRGSRASLYQILANNTVTNVFYMGGGHVTGYHCTFRNRNPTILSSHLYCQIRIRTRGYCGIWSETLCMTLSEYHECDRRNLGVSGYRPSSYCKRPFVLLMIQQKGTTPTIMPGQFPDSALVLRLLKSE